MHPLLRYTLDLFEPNTSPAPVNTEFIAIESVAKKPYQPGATLEAVTAPARFQHPLANREARLGEALVGFQLKRGKRRTIGFSVGPDGLVVSAPKWTPLYQVDAALAYFPRILGLREGRLLFDLPAGQVTPSQMPTHMPPEQRWPAGQSTPMHDVSTQMPVSVVHVRPGRHPSSAEQRSTHDPRSHTKLRGHSASPSSIMPLQSSSLPLQRSARGMFTCWQRVDIPSQMFTPCEQAPI
jgi:hypothetical protein